MTQIKITTNSNAFKKRLNQRAVVAEKEVRQAIALATFMVEGTVKEGIQGGPKTGRIYQKGNITHQASAKGEYPATDTGFLVSHISSRVNRKTGTVTSSADYSKELEYGTTKVAARPFMFPSLEKNRLKILKMFKDRRLLRRTS